MLRLPHTHIAQAPRIRLSPAGPDASRREAACWVAGGPRPPELERQGVGHQVPQRALHQAHAARPVPGPAAPTLAATPMLRKEGLTWAAGRVLAPACCRNRSGQQAHGGCYQGCSVKCRQRGCHRFVVLYQPGPSVRPTLLLARMIGLYRLHERTKLQCRS